MLFSKYSTRLSYINVSPFHLGPATTLASLLLARAILQIFEATLYEFLDPWILLFLFKMAEPRRPIELIDTKFASDADMVANFGQEEEPNNHTNRIRYSFPDSPKGWILY